MRRPTREEQPHPLWGPNQQIGLRLIASIATLQEIVGYCLTSDTSQQKAFLIVGPLRSGKGTIVRVLEHLVGIDNKVNPTLAELGSNQLSGTGGKGGSRRLYRR